MARKRKPYISDSPSEDLGYDRNHSQTSGGIQAYVRGELPLSYWSKKVLLKKVSAELRKMKREPRLYSAYRRFIQRMNMSEDEVLKKLSKVNFDELKRYLLTLRGTHYTGNFYRYTKFYGLVNPYVLLTRVGNKLVKPNEVIQLKLNIGV